jgi:hypothetical protein
MLEPRCPQEQEICGAGRTSPANINWRSGTERLNADSLLRVHDLVRRYRAVRDRQRARTKSPPRHGAPIPHPCCRRSGNRKPVYALAPAGCRRGSRR